MHRLCLVASLLFAACGPSASGGAGQAPSTTSGTPNPSASAATESDVHCTDEVRTGTHMEKKICRSEVEKEQDRRDAQEIYLNPNSRVGRP